MSEGLSPKEQAEQIVRKVFNEQHTDDDAKFIIISTKKIALYCADLLIENEPGIRHVKMIGDEEVEWTEYWKRVKQEIEKIFRSEPSK